MKVKKKSVAVWEEKKLSKRLVIGKFGNVQSHEVMTLCQESLGFGGSPIIDSWEGHLEVHWSPSYAPGWQFVVCVCSLTLAIEVAQLAEMHP